MYLFNRSISVNVRSMDSKTVSVNGVFLDTHHELCITLEVDVQRQTITAATGQFCRCPHTNCAETQERIAKLVGLKLDKSVRKQVLAAVGLKNGCTHITELTLECVKGFMQATYKLMNLSMPAEKVDELVEQYLEGSCFHYQKH
ncbi:DUF2889 domain-containing protein [Desulfosporosinus youngiae]|uniref:DUF2889 domain-containing protein n=1 Tax=Desulfosporosinus youngiae DSM 17734 TaxID=768710 RepID=H5Y0U9_9FIRM|nr:DUF2889 domain-containing protein [Desulfosporosinus youngiae]EHQ92355.1 Protein of unknown function (DUF2889) [Desulfosporosinus youngiae DSM 17734]